MKTFGNHKIAVYMRLGNENINRTCPDQLNNKVNRSSFDNTFLNRMISYLKSVQIDSVVTSNIAVFERSKYGAYRKQTHK